MTPASNPSPAAATPRPVTVGVDVGKRFLDAHADPLGRARRFPNDKTGRRALRNWVRKLGALRVALEPTGRYHVRLHECLVGSGIEVFLVNPRWARHFAKSIGREAKNDPVDAAVLALYGRVHVARASQPKPRILQQLSDLLTVRRNAVDVRQSVQQSANEIGGEAAAEYDPVLAGCDKAVRRCEAAMRALIASDPALRRRAEIIQSVPGCGFLNAVCLCACVPELGTVTARQAAALIGVAPYACDSGESEGRRRIRGGRAYPRRLLYLAATAAIRCIPQYRALYERLNPQPGDPRRKRHKLAMVAVMRNMVTLLGALLRDDRLWTPEPPPREAAA